MAETKRIKSLFVPSLICLFVLCAQFTSVNAEWVQLGNDNGTAEYYHPSLTSSGFVVGTVLTPNPEWAYPILVDSVEFLLYRFPEATSSATMKAHIYSTINGEPGTLLGSSASTTVTTFWPDWASISLASANVTLSSPEPFMVAIEYVAATPDSTPAMLTDTQDNVAARKNFYSSNGGATWVEHYDFWSTPETIGHGMVRATVNDTPPPETTEWKIYFPAAARNWSPPPPTPTPTPTPTPISPDPSDLPCLYALNWWRNDSPPYNIIRSSYTPPCLQATAVDVEHVYDNVGRQIAYRATVERQDELDFDMEATYIFGGGVEGADVIKTYVGGYQYQMEITGFCPMVGQLIGYKVKVYAPPYDGKEVTIGSCP